ncbi:hypothetical protein GC176_07970 [bacterium]|nr:hypothetical protein [bacterium]
MVIAAAVVFGTGMFSGFWTRLGVSLGFGVGVALIGLLFQGVQSFYEAIQDKSENVLTVVNAIFVSYVVVLGLLYFWFSWTHDLDLGEELTLISVLLFGIGVGKHFRSRVGTFIGQTSDVPDEVQPKPDHHKAGEG